MAALAGVLVKPLKGRYGMIDPGAIRERSIDGRDLGDALIYRVRAEGFTGKRNS